MPTALLHVSFLRTPGSHDEDVAVITTHWHGQTGGLPSTTEMGLVESAFGTFWNAYKVYAPAYVVPEQFRWYDQQVWPTLSPLLRVTPATSSPGTGTGSCLPPQNAVSITLQTANRKRWGRFYMPGPMVANVSSAEGRITTPNVDAIATAAHQMIQSLKSTSIQAVVWSPRGGKGPPPFSGGDTMDVTGIRVDDVVDIVRRRRWQDSPYHRVIPLT